jgi:DNA-binding MltR family transcriptional regulator
MYGNQVMPARTLLNLMLSYKVWRESRLFLNARNLLNATQKEYAFADDVSGMYLLGLRINI